MEVNDIKKFVDYCKQGRVTIQDTSLTDRSFISKYIINLLINIVINILIKL